MTRSPLSACCNLVFDHVLKDDRLVCDNPRCISSTEQELPHKFKLVDAERGIYRCIYCEAKKTLD